MAGSPSMLKNAPPLEHPAGYALTFKTKDGPVSIVIPKDPAANAEWRKAVLEEAMDDPEQQANLRGLCATPTIHGFLFFCNLFLYTFVVRTVDETGREVPVMGDDSVQPFITWPVQDEAAATIIDRLMNGGRVLVDKSRDMGASWLVLAIFLWMWLFFRNVNFLLISYEEKLVDNGADMNALMPKIDFMLEHLPGYLVPPFVRNNLKLERADGVRNSINGTATSGKKGRGGRPTGVLLDEAAFIRDLRKLWVSLSRSTHCTIAVSTADGPTYFSKLVRMAKSTVVRLMWWMHPQKGRGRYEARDDTGAQVISSPWRDEQIRRAEDALEISQEIDADDRAGGRAVFDSRLINTALAGAREHLYEGTIGAPAGPLDRWIKRARRGGVRFVLQDATGQGAWLRLWCELEEDENGLWRPNQDRTYVLGADVGLGVGQSNSTMSIIEVESGHKVGEVATPKFSTDEFARRLCMVGYWFGGAKGCAFAIWDSLGAGASFGIQMRKLGYPWFYMRTDEESVRKMKSAKPGFPTSPRGKQIILDALGAAWRRGEFYNPSQRAIEEANSYTWFDTGDAGMGEREDDSTGARQAHGDIVIADALAWHGATQWARQKPRERIGAPGSVAATVRGG